MTPEELERIVAALRDTYAHMRRFYSPKGKYQSQPKHDKMWQKIVPLLLENHIHPQHFVKTTFEHYLYELKRPVAWVGEVACKKAVERYVKRHATRDHELRMLIQLQLETASNQLLRGRALEEIIRDPTLELNVAIRYALALKAGLTKLAAELRPDAEVDLSYEPLYQELVRQMTGSAEQ